MPLSSGTLIALTGATARHVQVLRLQPGDAITLFGGGPGASGGEYEASIARMGRSEVEVRIGAHHAIEREASVEVHLALGMPANERMEWLIEKATELGVRSIQPLQSERSVLRLSGERSGKKLARWQAIAIAACEQCGRNQLPQIHEPREILEWLGSPSASIVGDRRLLSLRPGNGLMAVRGPQTCLSGPEGGLTPAEEDAAMVMGFQAMSLGLRVLRAETAALAALCVLTIPGPA
jgi:16S rRNA (uracil1498-N3)-methyltransferase